MFERGLHVLRDDGDDDDDEQQSQRHAKRKVDVSAVSEVECDRQQLDSVIGIANSFTLPVVEVL